MFYRVCNALFRRRARWRLRRRALLVGLEKEMYGLAEADDKCRAFVAAADVASDACVGGNRPLPRAAAEYTRGAVAALI